MKIEDIKINHTYQDISGRVFLSCEKAMNELTQDFCKKYDLQFVDWVADEIGTIFKASDYFFNFTDVLDAYRYNISREDLLEWYDQWVNPEEDATRFNMRTFLHLKGKIKMEMTNYDSVDELKAKFDNK